MRTVPIPTLINFSIKRTKLILFTPFSLKKWLLITFIALIAGALGGGNFGSSDNDNSEQPEKTHPTKINYAIETKIPATDGQYYISSDGAYQRDLFARQDQDGQFINTPSDSDINFGIIHSFFSVLMAIFIIPLAILLTWLNARFKFIWFNTVVNNDASVVEPFKRYHTEGNSLFKFYLLTALFLIVFIVGIAITASLTFTPQTNLLNFIILILIIFIIGALLIILSVYIDHFVVTIMAMDHCGIKGAWQKFSDIFRQNRKELALYILLVIGLGIVAAIISFLIMFVCVIILLIIGLIIFGIPYLLLQAKLLFVMFAVIAGIPFIVITLFIFLSIQLPFAVFFRSFSLYFLSSLDCGYSPLPIPEP